jgi:hypothetical protein
MSGEHFITLAVEREEYLTEKLQNDYPQNEEILTMNLEPTHVQKLSCGKTNFVICQK